MCKATLNVVEHDIDGEKQTTVEITGSETQRQRAIDYVNFVTQQRTGTVAVDLDNRDDLTVVPVPENCVAFVMGRGGKTLRSMEEVEQFYHFFLQDSVLQFPCSNKPTGMLV